MKFRFLLLLLSLSVSLCAGAKEIASVTIPESISFSGQTDKLILNGAGIRSKFFFDIYIGSLYLQKKANTAEEVYTQSGNKSVRMHFLYSEVSKEKLTDGWTKGFENNLSSDEFDKLKPRLEQFNALFSTVKKGDSINLDFTPDKGTRLVINNDTKGIIAGNDFFSALLKIWLGKEPADSDLKTAMLGK